MKILQLKTISPKIQKCVKKLENKFFPTSRFSLSQEADTFCRENYVDVISFRDNNIKKASLAQKALERISPTKYKSLSANELDAVRSQVSLSMALDAENIVNISKLIKNIFDNKYGENHYAFYSVGRSCSAIAKCLEFMGVEAKSIPISGCGGTRNPEELAIEISSRDSFKQYKKYLEAQRLQENNHKKHIFCDFASTGATLKVFKALLKHNDISSNHENIFIEINKLLYSIAQKTYDLDDEIGYFLSKLTTQKYDDYASINYVHFKELKYANYKLSKDKRDIVNLINFCLLDVLNEQKTNK